MWHVLTDLKLATEGASSQVDPAAPFNDQYFLSIKVIHNSKELQPEKLPSDTWSWWSVSSFKTTKGNFRHTLPLDMLPWKQSLCAWSRSVPCLERSSFSWRSLSEKQPLPLLNGPRARHWILMSSSAAARNPESNPDLWPLLWSVATLQSSAENKTAFRFVDDFSSLKVHTEREENMSHSWWSGMSLKLLGSHEL